jgi:uncharacterized membrane-anchored protein YitT (DUF2179 family)
VVRALGFVPILLTITIKQRLFKLQKTMILQQISSFESLQKLLISNFALISVGVIGCHLMISAIRKRLCYSLSLLRNNTYFS